LTKATDLALRIVMRLAVLDDQTMPTTREVAESVGAPHSHAAKVITRLQHLGVVEARRGRGGGLALTATGRTDSLGWLLRELEGVGDVVGCEETPACPLRSACLLRSALRAAQEAFYSALDPISIENLTAGAAGRMLLRLAPPAPAAAMT
jgi:Rrf2 family nitric oxide-sensitive transcriptional repressor